MNSILVKTISLFISSLLFSSPLFAAKPSVDDVKKMLDYYYNGNDPSIIVSGFKVCKDIPKKGELKNECGEELEKVKKGENAYVWMQFTAPAGQKHENLFVQFNQNGVTRYTRDVSIVGTLRYRVWKKFAMKKKGDWEAVLMNDNGEEVEELGRINFTVQ